MSRMLGVIWAEITTPTGQAGPLSAAYARAMSGVGHAVLGATFCAPLGASGIIMALAVAVIYWTAKERGDLRRGGLMWDGIEDALCVSLGAWYGVIWWPAAVLVAAANSGCGGGGGGAGLTGGIGGRGGNGFVLITAIY